MMPPLPLTGPEAARLYWELAQRGASSVGDKLPWGYKLSEEELLTLAVLQGRYDPRLLQILVDFFSRGKFSGNPVELKESLLNEKGLELMAVIGEFVLQMTDSRRAKELMRYLMTGVRPVPIQLFFPGLYRLGGKKITEVVEQPLWGFKKWGFLAADPPIPKEIPKKIYLFDLDSRRNLLKKLAKERGRFRLKDYLGAIGRSISRQQALKDLKGTPWIQKRGTGKGSYYQLKAA